MKKVILLKVSNSMSKEKELPKINSEHLVLSGDKHFFTVQGEGKSMGMPAVFLRLHYCNLRCKWCFSGNTLIQTPKRKQKIKKLKVGDSVLSFDGKNVVEDVVVKVFKRKVLRDDLVFIKLDKTNEDKIFVTKNHEFYVKDKWVKAEDLQSGDEIMSNEYGLWRMHNYNPMQDKNIVHKVRQKLKGIKSYTRTKKHRLLQRSKKLGKKNPRYVDGKRPSYLILWKKTRSEVLKRDHYTCQNCGNKERLEVHHITPYRISKDNSLNNLVTLCKSCHLKAENNIIFHNGIKVLDVLKVNEKQMARLDANKDWCYVYNVETKNHNYFAYNLLVHNCDTPYAVFPEDPRYFSEPKKELITEIKTIIEKYPCKRLVITGGEPLLQKKALDNFLALFSNDWIFEIETNGTQLPTDYMIKRGVQFNISPKLENSHNLKAVRYKPEILKHFNALSNAWFKFVVIDGRDLEEIKDIISTCGLSNDKILLMPEGTDSKSIAKHGRAIADIAKTLGWTLLPRLQITLWGAKRAV